MKENKKLIKTNLKRLDSLKDEDIDYSDIPELDDDFFKNAVWVPAKPKKSITVRYDQEVVDYFKKTIGRGYQSKMNAILKAYVEHHQQQKTTNLRKVG